MKVAIDAGHAKNTAGKRTPDDEREWSFNNIVAASLARELEANGVDVLRVDDYTGKKDISLADRVSKANNWGADIYISIHHNALNGRWGTHTGTETYIASDSSQVLANIAHRHLVRAMGLKDRGVKRANFYVLRKTKMPAILTEGGYMDSSIDIKVLRNERILKNAGIELARAVFEYGGIKVTNAGSTTSAATTSSTVVQTSSTVTKEITPDPDFEVLSVGAKGVAVKRIQAKLNRLGFAAGAVDGIFGGGTESAIRRFQQAAGLVVDGIYGANTAHALQYYEVPVKYTVIGKTVYSKVDGLRVYRGASWDDRFVYAEVNKGDKFTILSEHTVGDGKQYRVKNHRGQILYVTAADEYVEVK